MTTPEPQTGADLGHDYDGPELHPGTPEYAAGYAEYLASLEEPEADYDAEAAEYDVAPEAGL
jgi:hypothetical protein